MSSDRNTNRPLKPTLAANRTRSPLTPRVTPRVAGTPANSTRSAVSKTPSVRSEAPTPRVKAPNTPSNDPVTAANVTPRSSARKTRLTDSANSTPTQDDHTPSAPKVRSTIVSSQPAGERNGHLGGLGVGGGLKRASRPTSLVSEGGSKASSSLVRSPAFLDLNTQPTDETIESRFFHASDAPKHEPAPKKAEVKKAAAFFYADGKREEGKKSRSQTTSPVLSAVEKRSSGPWIRPDGAPHPSKSPPMLSPALSGISSISPFFPPPPSMVEKPRSPSPSKENIHLSYRKGVSQIFGTRPLQRPTEPIAEHPATPISKKESVNSTDGVAIGHRKSPSLSSIDSGNSQQSRRRSATTAEIAPTPSPLAHEMKSATVPRLAKPPASIDTTLSPAGISSPNADMALSPTKSVSELASDARRERKVLDLEISNSSLLAINSSLEREVRRQKAELKRFRRLSRAGRLSAMMPERTARFSEGLSVVGEEDEDDNPDATFGPGSGLSELYSDMSDDEDDESVLSSSEPRSPGTRETRENHRLAKDEKRLHLDLEKHKELLVQSQMMNQSLKRCMFATEDMIREGKKALEYHVRVSDVKLGGRVLSAHANDDDDGDGVDDGRLDIEIEDDFDPSPNLHGDDGAESPSAAAGSDDGTDSMAQAKGLLDVWSSLGRPSYESSEGGDRDSGIEVDRVFASRPLVRRTGDGKDMGRPPGAGS